jgi:hypothetical protein
MPDAPFHLRACGENPLDSDGDRCALRNLACPKESTCTQCEFLIAFLMLGMLGLCDDENQHFGADPCFHRFARR